MYAASAAASIAECSLKSTKFVPTPGVVSHVMFTSSIVDILQVPFAANGMPFAEGKVLSTSKYVLPSLT